LLRIPTKAGRPLGATKPKEKKAEEVVQFERKIEETVRALFAATGKVPTKTAVAEALGMGGVNRQTGSDSRLNSLNNKLRTLRIDYAAIIQRLRLHE
jgi:hypothetical protein